MWQRRKQLIKRSRKSHETPDESSSNKPGEKPSPDTAMHQSQASEFDLDRLLPQPLDDAAVTSRVQKLFSQIDAHVDSFYSDTEIAIEGHTHDETLANPASRLFKIKQLICRTLIESVGQECTSERSLLPYGFTTIARRLREPNLHDHATTLSWSRLRTSLAYLLRPESTSENARLNQAISTIVQQLNHKVQSFEDHGTTERRTQDLRDVCHSGAQLGQMLLMQPAVWKFDWDTQATSVMSRPGLVYYPALVRLTDNKAYKLGSPKLALQARMMQ